MIQPSSNLTKGALMEKFHTIDHTLVKKVPQTFDSSPQWKKILQNFQFGKKLSTNRATCETRAATRSAGKRLFGIFWKNVSIKLKFVLETLFAC